MIGRTIGVYRVVSQLGQGGMGVVYKAIDVRLDRPVALKVLPPDVSADERRRRRFLQEARAASALNDPHIVTVYDIFTEEGTDFLVMEYVQGRTLREVLTAGPVAVADALEWIAQIAEALALAHAAGIVHRDLKPGNLIVTARGLVKVLDFGLAKLTRFGDDQATFDGPNTQAGALLGTVDYMSPEQARGEAVDHRTDIFSLGAVAYELLAGARPFRAPHVAALLHEILYGTIVSPRSLRPELSPEVEAIVMRALERDVAKRYQTMERLAGDLRGGRSASQISRIDAGLLQSGEAFGRASVRAWRRPRILVPVVSAAAVVAVLAFASARQWVSTHLPWTGARVAMPAAAAPEGRTPYELTQAGLGLLQRFDRAGNVDKAIAVFESAIAIDKTFAPAWSGLARASWRQQRVTRDASWNARALDAARQAVGLSEYLADAHVSLGLVQLASGDLVAADAALRRALALDPKNAAAYRGLGDLAERQERLDDAVAAFGKAVELDAGDWELPRLAGTIPYKLGRYAEARDWYELASARAPDSAVPFNLLGATLHMLGDFASAAGAFQKSIAIQPTASVYTNLGTALFFQGSYRDSVAAFEKAVEMLPSESLYWGNLGDAYRWVPGSRDKAASTYQRAIQLLDQRLSSAPTDAEARSRLALYLAKAGVKARALEELRRVLTPKVVAVDTLYRGAVTYELCGDRTAALGGLEAALAQGYPMREVSTDPELAELRRDVRYHRLAARFEQPTGNR